jgi:hypothetical protein
MMPAPDTDGLIHGLARQAGTSRLSGARTFKLSSGIRARNGAYVRCRPRRVKVSPSNRRDPPKERSNHVT